MCVRDDGVAEAKERSGNSRSIATKNEIKQTNSLLKFVVSIPWSEASIGKRTATHNDESRKVFFNQTTPNFGRPLLSDLDQKVKNCGGNRCAGKGCSNTL